MPKDLPVAEVLKILETGKFEELKETIEDKHVEFKGAPYRLEENMEKWELAKDVSALANAEGGLILIGFCTRKDASSAVEYVDEVRPFELDLFDTDKHRNILNDWISPPIAAIEIRCFPLGSESGRIVAAIVVPATAPEGKPFLVKRTVEANGKVRGTQFGYYERVQDRIPAISAETLRTYVRDGMRFAEIMGRLDTLEAFWSNSTSTSVSGISDLDIQDRISKAEKALDRASRANVVLAATSTSTCAFPDLLKSRSAPIVRLLENPPVLRPEGFAITPSESTECAEIIEGRLRRRLARGYKLIELWQDGALIAIGPGDDDMLCWFMRNQTQPKPGLPIRNFVLTEVTLNFCRLVVEIFAHAEPKPKQVRLSLTLNHMTEDGVPCKLSPRDDGFSNQISLGPLPADARESIISSSFTNDFKEMDPGIVTYELLGRLYSQFGFNFDDMPYVQRDSDANRITPESLFHTPKA
jgi:hypothetical protein